MKNVRHSLRRRDILSLAAATGVAAAIPGARTARAATAPKRLLVILTPDGTVHDQWRPTGSGSDFTLPRILKPLEGLRDDLLILDGVRNVIAEAMQGVGDPHQQGMTQSLTGRPNTGSARSSGISMDEYVHQHISGGRQALRLSVVSPTYATDWTRMCFNQNGDPLSPYNSPYTARDAIFRDFTPGTTGPSPEELRQRAIRKRVLEYSRDRLGSRRATLGDRDRQRLDSHADAVEALLQPPADPVAVDVCSLNAVDAWPAGLDTTKESNFPTLTRMQMELISAAFACDRTRVATLQFSQSASPVVHSWVGATFAHHELSHHTATVAEAMNSSTSRAKVVDIDEWYAKQVAWIATDLKDKGLLDNTVILWTTDMADGRTHGLNPLPVTIIGGANHFQTGRYIDYRNKGPRNGVSHADVLTSVCNAMGIAIDKFGQASTCDGPLVGVT
ncbi:MAG: DUF1552 domain-containing protein [Polyangiales bacterium]|nr:DUF1552 domain-containing protein [Myxococcales bacterium]